MRTAKTAKAILYLTTFERSSYLHLVYPAGQLLHCPAALCLCFISEF